jgi:hypothetical protein
VAEQADNAVPLMSIISIVCIFISSSLLLLLLIRKPTVFFSHVLWTWCSSSGTVMGCRLDAKGIGV